MGVSARQQATTNVKNTVSCFKRLLGRKYKDQQVQDEIKNFPKPYTIVEGKSGETLIQVIHGMMTLSYHLHASDDVNNHTKD